MAFAFAILVLNSPQEVSGRTAGDLWHQPSVPLLASTIVMMALWVAGVRVVFSLPLDLRANWVFRVLPFGAGHHCLGARRLAIFALSVAPGWALSAAVLCSLWPWRPAAAHLAVLACLGIILAEFSLDGAQKLPFTCSYLPGRSNLNTALLFWVYAILGVLTGGAVAERRALEDPALCTALLAGLGIAALFTVVRNHRFASPGQAELRFEEEPPGRLLTLGLS